MSSSQTLIDRFITALWLEDGLAANSQAAYRRDISALAVWLAEKSKVDLLSCQSHDLQAYLAARAAGMSYEQLVVRLLSLAALG